VLRRRASALPEAVHVAVPRYEWMSYSEAGAAAAAFYVVACGAKHEGVSDWATPRRRLAPRGSFHESRRRRG